MSEFMEKHAVSRLIGAPPGYVGHDDGGYLTEAVRRRPYSVILFDEVEKAHADIFNILLQILDDGRLTDGKGRTVDFKNSIIVMTSNLGSNLIQDKALKDNYSDMKSEILNAVNNHFKPEFINRIDDLVVFRQLSEADIGKIVDIQFSYLHDRLLEHQLNISLSEGARKKLSEVGFDPIYGARPLKRAIQQRLENPLADQILRGNFVSGDTIKIGIIDDRLEFLHAA